MSCQYLECLAPNLLEAQRLHCQEGWPAMNPAAPSRLGSSLECDTERVAELREVWFFHWHSKRHFWGTGLDVPHKKCAPLDKHDGA